MEDLEEVRDKMAKQIKVRGKNGREFCKRDSRGRKPRGESCKVLVDISELWVGD